MIAKLSGRLDSQTDGACIIDVGGVGYLVFCSGRTLAALPQAGEAVSLQIETQVREDHIHLFGFAETAERDWFRLLLTVQGVGSRVALAILSTLQPGELLQAILAQDKKQVSRAQGVGPKLAGRIVSELKDKTGNIALGPGATIGESAPVSVPAAAGSEAISALVNLGYRQSEAQNAVQTALSQLGAEAALSDLIRDSLKSLAR